MPVIPDNILVYFPQQLQDWLYVLTTESSNWRAFFKDIFTYISNLDLSLFKQLLSNYHIIIPAGISILVIYKVVVCILEYYKSKRKAVNKANEKIRVIKAKFNEKLNYKIKRQKMKNKRSKTRSLR
jgi:predicted membrane protein